MHEKGYVFRENKYFGPMSIDEIKELISRGALSTHHYYWGPGMAGWQKLQDFESFRAYASLHNMNLCDNEFEKMVRADTRFINIPNVDLEGIPIFKDKNLSENDPEHFKNSELNDNQQQYLSKENSFDKNSLLKIWPILLIILVGLALSYFSFFYESYQNQILQDLSDTQISAMQRAINTSLNPLKPVADLIAKPRKVGEESQIIVGTNAEAGSQFEISVSGVPETLIDSHREEHKVQITIQKPLTILKNLRKTNGASLPIGKYNYEIVCENCDKKQHVLIDRGSFFLGDSEKSSLYRSQLKGYHTKVRDSANTELVELSQIIAALQGQVEDTYLGYSQLKGSKWKSFSQKWTTLHHEILDAFEEVNNPIFYNNLYYAPIYLELKNVAHKIYELHKKQSDKISSSKIEKLNSQINLDLAISKKKLSLMKENYLSSKGMPSRKGL